MFGLILSSTCGRRHTYILLVLSLQTELDGVPFVGGGASKRQCQTDDETEDGEKDARHLDCNN